MYNFSDEEAEEFVEISKNLSKIVQHIIFVKDEKILSTFEQAHKIHEWCEKARIHKAFSLKGIQEMYNQIDEKYKEFFGKSRRDYLNEKAN